MRKIYRIIPAALLGLLASAALLTAPVSAENATADDVFAAMREIGLPDGYIQAVHTKFLSQPDQHDENGMTMNGTYRSYDEWINVIREEGALKIYEASANAMGVDVETLILMFGEPEKIENYVPSVTPEKPFAEMTLEEKRAYVDSLPEEERALFLASLTPEERNSILKQLDPEQKEQVAGGLIELGEELGMHISVDDVDEFRFSVRDDSGRLIGSAGFGLSVDATGWNTTVPVLAGSGMILLSVGGLLLLTRRTGKQEDEQHG